MICELSHCHRRHTVASLTSPTTLRPSTEHRAPVHSCCIYISCLHYLQLQLLFSICLHILQLLCTLYCSSQHTQGTLTLTLRASS